MEEIEQLSLWEDKDLEAIINPPQQILIQLQKNALCVAKNLQENYFFNTTKLIQFLKTENQDQSIFKVRKINHPNWENFQNEIVTFIDGGVGQIESNTPIPVFVRVGSYRVKTGEYDLSRREQFAYYPVMFGDLEGGSKERKDFVDIVRITCELLGAIAALERNQELKVLSIHGPLMYMMNAYAGHTPFTENDIDLFLKNYSKSPRILKKIKNDFFEAVEVDYQLMTSHHQELIKKRMFEPLTFICFLYQKFIKEAKSRKRKVKPIIFGSIERNNLKEFSIFTIFSNAFDKLKKIKKLNYFNDLYGRQDLDTPKNIVDRLNYTDSILLSFLLENQELIEPWNISNKYENLEKGCISLPNDSRQLDFNWSCLKPNSKGKNKLKFPKIQGSYLKVSETTEPIRIETFHALGQDQMNEAANRAYLYSQLLPGYGFPVGLDIVDKYAKVPQWMTNAYAKQIQYHLGVSLQSGQIKDEEMRRLLIQSMYMTKRDWLFRPST